METTITFLGGAGTVTGSRHLLDFGDYRVLVDCGLFQGARSLRDRNWHPFPIDPRSIDAIILTHAHLDHSGSIPRLIQEGFKGPVFASAPSRDLCALLLPDSGHIQEQDALFANRHGYTKHNPAKPLYTHKAAVEAISRFHTVPFCRPIRMTDSIQMKLLPSGHILGSAFVEVDARGEKIVFTGDLGRPGDDTMAEPTAISHADYLILESTYGDRQHVETDPAEDLANIIKETASRGGSVIIPAFAVGRAQSLLHRIAELSRCDQIPAIPVFLDSPMAINASDIFCKYLDLHRLSRRQCMEACDLAEYTNTVAASKALDESHMPSIVISASGMATGGRILHHLKHFAPSPLNTILFTGFQAAGTRGERMVAGAKEVKIHGQMIPVKAQVRTLHGLSAHADKSEIMSWLSNFKEPPQSTFITHGEPSASIALRTLMESELHWNCSIPVMGQSVPLSIAA